MKKSPRIIYLLYICLTVTCTLSTNISFSQSVNATEDTAIRGVVNRFYEGWNSHDVEKMVSVYSDSIDHVNAFGEWHTGKQTMKEELTKFHAGPAGKNSTKIITIEKIRFIKSDVAVALVRQVSTVGNIGTFVLSKVSGKWIVVNFANVPYKLEGTGAK
jgi:uncharacterized protein (TIGR02246 family)